MHGMIEQESDENYEELVEELPQWQEELERLQKLRPVQVNHDALKVKEIPSLEEQIKQQESDYPEISSEVEKVSSISSVWVALNSLLDWRTTGGHQCSTQGNCYSQAASRQCWPTAKRSWTSKTGNFAVREQSSGHGFCEDCWWRSKRIEPDFRTDVRNFALFEFVPELTISTIPQSQKRQRKQGIEYRVWKAIETLPRIGERAALAWKGRNQSSKQPSRPEENGGGCFSSEGRIKHTLCSVKGKDLDFYPIYSKFLTAIIGGWGQAEWSLPTSAGFAGQL